MRLLIIIMKEMRMNATSRDKNRRGILYFLMLKALRKKLRLKKVAMPGDLEEMLFLR